MSLASLSSLRSSSSMSIAICREAGLSGKAGVREGPGDAVALSLLALWMMRGGLPRLRRGTSGCATGVADEDWPRAVAPANGELRLRSRSEMPGLLCSAIGVAGDCSAGEAMIGCFLGRPGPRTGVAGDCSAGGATIGCFLGRPGPRLTGGIDTSCTEAPAALFATEPAFMVVALASSRGVDKEYDSAGAGDCLTSSRPAAAVSIPWERLLRLGSRSDSCCGEGSTLELVVAAVSVEIGVCDDAGSDSRELRRAGVEAAELCIGEFDCIVGAARPGTGADFLGLPRGLFAVGASSNCWMSGTGADFRGLPLGLLAGGGASGVDAFRRTGEASSFASSSSRL